MDNFNKGYVDRSSYSAEDFNNLLRWLDPDEQRAAEKYEDIRQGLVLIFIGWEVSDPEELADETIKRVTKHVSEIASSYHGDPSRYFYGIAKNIRWEYYRQAQNSQRFKEQDLPAIDSEQDENRDRAYECLQECMTQLPKPSRELIMAYYTRRAKVDAHKTLAGELKVSQAALRVRLFRTRRTLQKCVENCMKSRQRSK